MKINNINVPDVGSTKQYIADPVGGWIYIVTTEVRVEQRTLDRFNSKIDEAKTTIAEAQAVVDELEPVAAAFEKAREEIVPDEA